MREKSVEIPLKSSPNLTYFKKYVFFYVSNTNLISWYWNFVYLLVSVTCVQISSFGESSRLEEKGREKRKIVRERAQRFAPKNYTLVKWILRRSLAGKNWLEKETLKIFFILEKHNTALSKKSWLISAAFWTIYRQQAPCINSRGKFRQVKRKERFSCNFMRKNSNRVNSF